MWKVGTVDGSETISGKPLTNFKMPNFKSIKKKKSKKNDLVVVGYPHVANCSPSSLLVSYGNPLIMVIVLLKA